MKREIKRKFILFCLKLLVGKIVLVDQFGRRKFGMRKATSCPPFRLLSKVIPENTTDGYYPFQQGVWLCYNEAFRRELQRLHRAFMSNSFNPIACPWKAVALYVWLSEYFLPVARHHENNKRLIMKPHYEINLGYIISPEAQLDYSESYLVAEESAIISHARELCALVLCKQENKAMLKESVKQCITLLRKEVQNYYENYRAHCDAEERYWPAIIEKTGLSEWNKMVVLCAANDQKQPNRIGELYFTLIFHALGYDLQLLQYDEDELDIPWCGAGVRMDIIKKPPFISRMTPAVQLMKRGLRYKTMINSIATEDDDVLDVVEYYLKKQAATAISNKPASLARRFMRWYCLCGAVPAGNVISADLQSFPSISDTKGSISTHICISAEEHEASTVQFLIQTKPEPLSLRSFTYRKVGVMSSETEPTKIQQTVIVP